MPVDLSALRAQLQSLHGWTRPEPLPSSLLPGGFPRGALVEIAGFGKTEIVARLLAEHPHLPAAWIEHTFSVFPPALRQRNANLDSIFFIESGEDSAWAAATLLRTPLFPLLIYGAPYGEEKELRRFQLLAERSAATVILLPEGPPSRAWPISLCLEVKAGRLKTLRRR